MSESTQTAPDEAQTQLDSGAYGIIRNRLRGHGDTLRARLQELNEARRATFGAVETKLVGSERITTDNNCTPRDMVPVGDCFLFGYNVQLGLRAETKPEDVFAIYQYTPDGFQATDLNLIDDENFHRDFFELYKYYKHTRFARFKIIGPHLFMKFRVGQTLDDFKTFKWIIRDGKRLEYAGNRSDHEFVYPAQHQFEWQRTKRDWFRMGRHPHISIEDRVFVETVGGDLTIKVEDNTDTGSGILDEPVDNPDQTLDDAEVHYASVGSLIILKILPYQEKNFRYYVFNEKLSEAHRIDAIGDSCVLLPDGQGLIFPRGFYLTTGELKIFDAGMSDMIFERRIDAPNGEDFLYVFYNRREGVCVLLAYNLIEQRVANPIMCNGYSIFEDGVMIYFRREDEPGKHHAIQKWQTSFTGPNFTQAAKQDSPLYKIGNKDIVRCMAECHEVLVLIEKESVYESLYMDLVRKTTAIIDTYFWLKEPKTGELTPVLKDIRTAANGAIEEYEKVTRIRKATAQAVEEVAEKARKLFTEVDHARLQDVSEFVEFLAALRSLRGEIITVKERRYVDLARVEALETDSQQRSNNLSRDCVAFLLKDEALDPYRKRVAELGSGVDTLKKVTDAKSLEEDLDQTGSDLDLLIEIVSNLKIEDATQTTRIIDAVSDIYGQLNQVKAAVKNRSKELAQVEGVAEFNAQMKLLSQSLVNYLDVCEVPEQCETYLTKLMVQVEELEGKFAEFEAFIEQLAEKREEIYNAFEARRLQLVEGRNKRAAALAAAADRILRGIRSRAGKFDNVNDINGYFAGDIMIEKVREIVNQLKALDDTVKADDVQSQLKTIREETVRQLKDRQDLYGEDGQSIALGNHRFSVNAQNLALTIVAREDRQYYHLTGTNFFEEIEEPDFLATQPVWDLEAPSETRAVYRAEYLAFKLLQSLINGEPESLADAHARDDADRLELVRAFMGPRYSEGYTKGVHDHDAARLLSALLDLHTQLGLLAYEPQVRAAATLFWHRFCSETEKRQWSTTCASLRAARQVFPKAAPATEQEAELATAIADFLEQVPLFSKDLAARAGAYLFRELLEDEAFSISLEAAEVYRAMRQHLEHRKADKPLAATLESLSDYPRRAFQVAREWVDAFIATDFPVRVNFRDEVAALVLCGHYQAETVADVAVTRMIDGFRGDHPLIEKGTYHLDYNQFQARLRQHESTIVPAFTQYMQLKKRLTQQATEDLRLNEFKPRVLSSFVRNKLINDVYLPIIGENLAKQIGTVGEQKRTDRMGMLLLVSPPGYGKTTLMEYIANRLGLIFMKINGPAIGHDVTAIDPAAAQQSAAREELKKLNLALEMGDNVMIYLDDIQHCNPELLQKFISLCDAQRKIEGVYKGRPRTYDLRGKKVCVVMAGNPYTESGDKFQIPDMLANRADTYNLGDIIGDSAQAFELSYIENALTSNTILAKLSSRSQQDVYALARAAETGKREDLHLEGNYSADEVNEFLSVFQKMFRVRDVILKVNQAYIQSAAQEDAYRTEPPFKLQGSYRNMNKIAEKVMPIMNDEELETLLLSHYENESQTLTSGAEANLLKFKELTGHLSETEAARWEEIKRGFRKKQQFHGIDTSDRLGQVIATLSGFGEGLTDIKTVLDRGLHQIQGPRNEGPVETRTSLTPESFSGIQAALEPILAQLAEQRLAPATDAPPDHEAAQGSGEDDERYVHFLLKTVREQFNIMRFWLKPTYEHALSSQKQIDQLQTAVKASMDTHQDIMAQLQGLLNSDGTVRLPPNIPKAAAKTNEAKPAKSTKANTAKTDSKKPPPRRRKPKS